jgi:hypothetical protein
MVRDELWALTGIGPDGGMLCLADLEKRIGRPLEFSDFTAMAPPPECWNRHLERRASETARNAGIDRKAEQKHAG